MGMMWLWDGLMDKGDDVGDVCLWGILMGGLMDGWGDGGVRIYDVYGMRVYVWVYDGGAADL